MKLLTKEVCSIMPGMKEQDGLGKDAVVYLKFFAPWTSWTWYATEGAVVLDDGTEKKLSEYPVDDRLLPPVEDVLFFGLVDGFEKEFGYFTLRELLDITGPMGLKVERDMHFGRKTLGEVCPEIFTEKNSLHRG